MSKKQAARPNILFILTDDQRFDTIRALGNQVIHTPNLDRLVQQGTAFSQAHIPCGMAGAVCMPSRAMIHTGRQLFSLEKEGQEIPPEHSLLGQWLQEAGYHTFGSGKWHNGPAAFARSFNSGGSIFFGGMWDHWNVPVCDYDPSGRYDRAKPFISNPFAQNKISWLPCDRISPGRHSTELISQTAIDFLENYQLEQPFFLYSAFLAPHDPRSMPSQFLDLYDPDQIKLPDNFLPQHPFDFGVSGIRDELLAASPRQEKEIRQHLWEYYAMISHLDYEIGRMIDALARTGRLEDTIIILAGDNGLALGQHGLMGKQNCYEHSVRVPLIFAGPGITKNKLCCEYVYLLDIFPTICQLLDLPCPASVEGQSLLPLLQGQPGGRKELYFAYTDLVRAVKDQRYKLVEYSGPARRTQLFDLDADPAELNNLADQAGFAGTVAALRQKMAGLRDNWQDKSHPLGQAFWQAVDF